MTFSTRRKSAHFCGNCSSFRICSKVHVKNARRETDYCLWEEDLYQETLMEDEVIVKKEKK